MNWIKLDKDNNVVECTMLECEQWRQDEAGGAPVRVSYTWLKHGVIVSTVVLPFIHPGGAFETMVSRDDGETWGEQHREELFDHSVAYHARLVNELIGLVQPVKILAVVDGGTLTDIHCSAPAEVDVYDYDNLMAEGKSRGECEWAEADAAAGLLHVY